MGWVNDVRLATRFEGKGNIKNLVSGVVESLLQGAQPSTKFSR